MDRIQYNYHLNELNFSYHYSDSDNYKNNFSILTFVLYNLTSNISICIYYIAGLVVAQYGLMQESYYPVYKFDNSL